MLHYILHSGCVGIKRVKRFILHYALHTGCAGIKRALCFRMYYTADTTVSLWETGLVVDSWVLLQSRFAKT